jgi:excisionase family DNA binding protein
MENETTEDRQMADERLVYSVDEVAQKLSISRNLAYRLARQGKLPGVIHVGNRRMVCAKAKIDALLAGGVSGAN